MDEQAAANALLLIERLTVYARKLRLASTGQFLTTIAFVFQRGAKRFAFKSLVDCAPRKNAALPDATSECKKLVRQLKQFPYAGTAKNAAVPNRQRLLRE